MTRKTLIRAAAAFVLVSCVGRIAAQQHETDNQIRFFQWKVKQDPDDQFNYDRLGVAYIQKARETGDVTYYDLAAKSLEKSLALESKAPEAAPPSKHLATVYYAEHRFAEALALAQQALALNPRDLTPYALIGDAHCEMGDYQQAWVDYAHLNSTIPQSALSAMKYLEQSRESVRRLMTGDIRGAIAHMQAAAQTAMDSGMAAESIAWSQFTLGEYSFQIGELTGAKVAYSDALKTYPKYHRALAGLAKVAAAEGHLPESIELYKQAIAIIPLPAYAAALGDVYAKAGKSVESKKSYDLVEFIARLNTFNQTVYNRELAVFYADHDVQLAKSLQFARKEFEVRHDIYTWDALAWAQYKNAQPQEAAAAIKEALRLGTRDPLLLFHAGMIYERLGDKAKAEDYLRQAVDLNPQFQLLYAELAKSTLQNLSKASLASATQRTPGAQP